MPERSALETPACPACGAAATPSPISWSQPARIHRCPDCALRFARPIPSQAELDAFYQGFLYRKPAREKLPRLLVERERELISLFGLQRDPKAERARSFLDHGGGTGL